MFLTLSQRVMVSAVKSPAHLGTKQLVEFLFSSQAIGHCKSTPTTEHGFLVQVKQKNNLNSLRKRLDQCCSCDFKL